MLNPGLDFPLHWKHFSERGRVQIPDVLIPELAEQLHQCLTDEVGWALATRDEEGVSRCSRIEGMEDTSNDVYLQQVRDAAARSLGRYGFLYESYMMVRAYKEGRDPGLLLHRVLEYMNSEPYLQFCRTVADTAAIRRVSAQATRFRPGMFLKAHNDYDAEEGRVVAYVLNLSRDWQADWGGLLQFLDEDGVVVDTMLPRYNSLSLFRVPVQHCVSMVSPWALSPRLAITGWWETGGGE